MATYRVAGVQMEVARDLRDNLGRILDHVAWAGRRRVQFCLFPEMALSGYHGAFDQQEVEAGLARIAEAAVRHEVAVLIGTGWREAGRTTIQLRTYSEAGVLLGVHTKLVPTLGEREWCVPGEKLDTFRHRGLNVGMLICNDLWVTPGCGPYHDPRLCYQLGQRGVRVVFHAIHSGSAPEFVPYHESNLALRARESGLHIVTANASAGDKPVNCTSGVMTPQMEWLTRIDRVGEGRFVADLTV